MEITNHIREKYDFPICDTYGEGHQFEVGDQDVITIASRNKEQYRRGILSITSFNGFGGIHYYAEFTSYISNHVIGEGCSISGYLGGYKVPAEFRTLTFELMRPLTRCEIKKYPERFEYYKTGDLTNAFYTQKRIVELFKKLVPFIFKGKWEIEIDSFCGKFDETVIVNN